MATYTSRLNATKPASSENVNITTLNDNFDLFDTAAGATVASAASKPASAFSGRLWWESDTGLLKINTASSASAVASWTSTMDDNVVDVTTYGAIGTGAVATSAANNAAFAAAASTGYTVYVPPGTYYGTYDLDPATDPKFVGSFSGDTFIKVAAGHYFVDANRLWGTCLFKDITFQEGAGAIRNRYTGTNVTRLHRVIDCTFLDFTVCAISANSSDMPFWKIVRPCFNAANDTAAICIALKGGTDLVSIVDPEFQKYKIGVKLGAGGANAKITLADFVQYEPPVGGNLRAMVWLVPGSDVHAGSGMMVRDSKFGNENLGADDYRVLIADESSGTYFGDKLPTIAADSTGNVSELNIRDCQVAGSDSPGPRPVIYTTTQHVHGFNIGPLIIDGTPPSYGIQVRTVITTADSEQASNIFGPVTYVDNNFDYPFSASNQPGLLTDVRDHTGMLTTSDRPMLHRGGARPTGFVNLLANRVNSFTLNGSSPAKTTITDAVGGTDAMEQTVGWGCYTYVAAGTVKTDQPVWLEFDLMQGGSNPLSRITVSVAKDDATSASRWLRKNLVPDSKWRSYRYLLHIPSTADTTTLQFYASPSATGERYKLGRVRMYHAQEPVLNDLVLPDVTTGTSAVTTGTVTVPAAAQWVRVYINGAPKKMLVWD